MESGISLLKEFEAQFLHIAFLLYIFHCYM